LPGAFAAVIGARCARFESKVIAMFRRSRILLLMAPAALVTWAAAVGAPGQDLPTLHSMNPPSFTADLAVAVDSTSRARVKAVVSIPYPELNWQRAGDGYSAGASYVVELVPDKGPRRLYGDAWEKRILVPDYAATTSHRNQLVETREFDVPPGKYDVRVSVRDIRALAESEVRDRLEVRDLSAVPVGFADLELGVMDSSSSFVPFPSREFGFNSGAIAVRAVLVDRRSGGWPRQYRYHWRVLDEGGTADAQGDTTVTVGRLAQPVVLRPPHGDLFIGDYTFELEMREGKTAWRTSRTFSVEESGPPHGREFDQMLEALAYIADPAEVEGMRGKPPEQQAALWDAFWKRRDPTPDTPRNEYQIEFFRRMHYAEQHFLGFGPGWRSDMGRTYIRYGPADQVEQRQATSGQPGLEIWYYNQPYRRLVFADREGFGRYTLLNPQGE
jgi:GWxTD domain-containing protein